MVLGKLGLNFKPSLASLRIFSVGQSGLDRLRFNVFNFATAIAPIIVHGTSRKTKVQMNILNPAPRHSSFWSLSAALLVLHRNRAHAFSKSHSSSIVALDTEGEHTRGARRTRQSSKDDLNQKRFWRICVTHS